jgi:hypothetical protein
MAKKVGNNILYYSTL